MNKVNVNDKTFVIADGGVDVSENTANLTIEASEGDTVELLVKDFTELSDSIEILDDDAETVVASYQGFNTLNSVKKNVADGTITVQLIKRPYEERFKELESAIDVLTETALTE